MAPRTHCPACLSPTVARRLQVAEMMFGIPERFSYIECECGTLRIAEIPADLGRYYPQNYYSVDEDPEVTMGRQPVRTAVALTCRSVVHGQGTLAQLVGSVVQQRQFHTLMSITRSVRAAGLVRGPESAVLDVGCGSGALVYALSLAGLRDVMGVDPFAPGDRRLDVGATIRRADLSELAGTYDLVMFHHSLEHVPDPEASLRRATELLSPEGRILVRMPTTSSEAYATFGSEWVQLDAPRHLTVLSRTGMESLCERAGLRIVDVRDDSTAFQFWGSEQVRAGIALNDPRSRMHGGENTAFSARQVRDWEREAGRLNARSRGDQAAWVLRPAVGG